MVAPIENPCEFGEPEPCGVNPAFTYTRYPCDYDDPRETDTRGLPVIVDLQTLVRAEVVNRQRESILAMEAELGIQPSGTFTTVRDRLDYMDSFLCSIWNNLGTVEIQHEGTQVLEKASIINFLGNVTVQDVGDNKANVTIIGGDGYAPVHEGLTVTMDNQTSFTLSEEPGDPSYVVLWNGGIKQQISDYSITGTTVAWLGAESINLGDIVEVLYFKPSTGGGSGGPVDYTQEVFTAGAAQVAFGLSNAPTALTSVEMFITGVSQTVGVDYTLLGSTVSYIGAPALAGGEAVVIKYFY